MSPHKRANPLGWPFGTLPALEWARLKREQPQPVREPAPF